MQPSWTPLLSLVLGLAVLIPASRWLGTRIQRLVFLFTGNTTVALYVYFVLLLPGTLLHELSHWLTARLLGVRTAGITLRPRVGRDNKAQFGSVTIGRTDPIRESLIGVAPLLIGSAVVVAIAAWHLRPLPLASSPIELLDILAALVRVPDAWLWLYIMLAISNAMLPSASDRQSWHWAALIIALIIASAYLLGIGEQIPATAFTPLQHGIAYLATVFISTALLDVLLGSILWTMEEIAGWLLGRRVEARASRP
jgi:hypothetical protein